MYPQGDHSAKPSAKMPNGGYYFDSIIRQPPIDDSKLTPADNLEEFQPISDEALRHYEQLANDLYANTDEAIGAGFPGTAFGDIALVPGPWMKDPKGIRDIEEWYISTITRREYIREVFARQAEIAVENLKRIHQAVGDKVHVVFMDGTDLASQTSLFCSPDTYRDSTCRTPRRSTTGSTPTRSGRPSSTVAAGASRSSAASSTPATTS